MKWDELMSTAHAALESCRNVPFCEVRLEKAVSWSAAVSQNRISKLYCTVNEGINVSLYSKEKKMSLFLPGEKAETVRVLLPSLVEEMAGSPPSWMGEVETESCHLAISAEFHPDEEALSMARWTLQEIPPLQRGSIKMSAIATCGFVKKAYMNSIGAESESSLPFSEYNLFLRGGPLNISYSGYLDRSPHRSQDMLTAVVKYMNDMSTAFSRARKAKPSKCPLVMDVVPFSILVHEVFGHLLEYDLAVKNCFHTEDIETAVVPQVITIRDSPSLEDFFYIPFDDEGTVAKETLLVEKGVLKTFLVDRKTACETNQSPNGNSRAECYRKTPMIRSRITELERGDHGFQELLEEAEGGLYLYGAFMVDAHPDGNFTVGVPLAYTIQKGELGDPVIGIKISGNIFDLFKKITALENRSRFQIGHCSKGTSESVQYVRVGTVCPRAAFTSWDVECGIQ